MASQIAKVNQKVSYSEPLSSKKNNNADKNVSSTQGSINRIIIREKIKKYVVENSAKGKCKMVADTLKRKADHLPPKLKQMSKEDGLSKIKGVVSLTTKLYKVLKSNDLTLLYVKGIQRQSIKELKDSQNVPFIGKNICKMTILKNLTLYHRYSEFFGIFQDH